MRRNISKRNTHLVVLVDGEFARWCDIVINESRNSLHHRGTLGIGLGPGFRENGIGTALLRFAIDDAFSKSIFRIELMLREQNARAIALFQRCKFLREGVLKSVIR